MTKIKRATEVVGQEGFPWELYENGMNGINLRANYRINTGNKKTIVYSHAQDAEAIFNAYMSKTGNAVKDVKKNALVAITDVTSLGNNQLLASINNGAGSITIDLNKEDKFFNILTAGDEKLTKEKFVEYIQDPTFKKTLLDMGLVAKVGTDIEKASIWNGYVENIAQEMREQITLNTKAYTGKIISSNNGGFTVEVAGVINAFMPGSMAAANRVTDYQSLVGKTIEVMIESFDKKAGFIVSHKKYLRTITPIHMNNLKKEWEEAPDTLYTGTVTGTTPFGIFVELTSVLTGMLHKTLISDDLREQLRKNQVAAGTAIDVYIHKIENNRIILSDVALGEREAVIAKREAEDAAEKSQYAEPKRSDRRKPAAAPKLSTEQTSIELA